MSNRGFRDPRALTGPALSSCPAWMHMLIAGCLVALVTIPVAFAVSFHQYRRWFFAQTVFTAAIAVFLVGTSSMFARRVRRHQLLTESVGELGKRALSVEQPDELLTQALRVAMQAIGADYGTALRHLDGNRVRVAAEIGPDPTPQGSLLPIAESGSYIMHVLATGQPLVSPDVRNDPRITAPKPLIDRGVVSSMSVPVFGPNSTVGVLGLHSHSANRFSQHDVALLQALATVVATAWAQASHRETMTYQALHDSMTGLPNRTLFFDRLDHALLSLTRPQTGQQRGIAVMVMDLDNFKTINDTLGHGTGDEVLIRTCQRLAQAVRPGDTVARLGGDEFALLCDPAPPDAALDCLAQRLLAAVSQPMDIEGSIITVRMSIGAALTRSPVRLVSDSSALMQEADAALYRAKGGGGGVCVFDKDIHRQVRRRVQLEADLHAGLQRGEFVVHYQPVRDPSSRRIVGVEALVRWRHPDHGLLMPGQFLPVAEQTGLIVPLGLQVMRTACEQMARWQQRRRPSAAETTPAQPSEHEPLWVAVNVSARQLEDSSLPEQLSHVLHSSGLPASCLLVELTETAVIHTGSTGAQVLRQLREQGISLGLDDFGTGFSSLTHLTRLPIQVLKVDRSFVEGIGVSERDSAVVASVAALGRQLGLRVIAEGVQTPEQLLRVIELDCYGAQGFLLDHPADVPTLERTVLRALPQLGTALGPVVGAAGEPTSAGEEAGATSAVDTAAH